MRRGIPSDFMKIDFYHHYQTTPCARGRIRCLAMLHLQKGKTIKEVAEIVQQSRVSISHCLRWLREGHGIEKLVGYVKGRGRKAKVSLLDEEELKSEVEKMRELRSGGRVTGKDIQTMIKKYGILSMLYQAFTLC
jgi:transposase